MPFDHLLNPHADVDFIIVHYNASNECRALTISSPSKEALIRVNHPFWSMVEAEEIHNFDDSKGHDFHGQLHGEMAVAMGNVSFAATLTDFHQHWVTKSGAPGMGGGQLMSILNKLKVKQFITKQQMQGLLAHISS